MLPLGLILAVTATAAEPEVVEEEIVEEEYEEEYEEEEIDPELEARDRRWFTEDAFHFALHAGVAVGTAEDDPYFIGSLAFGFSQRLAQRWALQGRASIGGGFANTRGEGLFDGGPPMIDSSVDLTGRVGSRRFYFGFGPFGRLFRVFRQGRALAGGGGGVVELGMLLGDDRQLDLGARLSIGGFADEDRHLQLLINLGISVGWIF